MEMHVATNMADGIRPALVDRCFLHSNSTSHEWMFGAIAELIDNACDPDVNASQFWIDIQNVADYVCLTLMDNGGGMDTETLHRMLSFGFSDKREINGQLPIGRYGNGFKSGSMRLGQDTLVFTRQHNKTMSVGFLSQTYLEKIDSPTVVVPIVTWDVSSRKIIYPDTDCKRSLGAILEHSLFTTEDELLDQLALIPTRGSKQAGSRIFIYNLAKDEAGNLELDFTSDIEDIRIPQMHLENSHNIDKTESAVSLYRVSLRKYVSILYLKPRMQIFLRGKKVKSLCLSKLLTNKKQSTYMPKSFSLTKPIRILFGQNPNEDEHGIMMFNRNRLIQAFRKNIIRKQSDVNNPDIGNLRELVELVIGVVELDCLTPNHIKQGFQDDNKFRTVELALTTRLASYCTDMLDKYNEIKNSADPKKKEKDIWVQCDNAECQRWRRLPYGTNPDSLPEKWFCRMNPDKYRNVCGTPEEPEKDPEIQPRKAKKRQHRSASEAPSSTSDVVTPLSPPERQPSSWKPGDPVSPTMGRVLQSLSEHSVVNAATPGSTLNGRHRLLQPTTPSTDLITPPRAKRNRSNFMDTTALPVSDQEVIVLDDDDDDDDDTSVIKITSNAPKNNNSTFIKMEGIEVVLSKSGDTSNGQVKSETFTIIPVVEAGPSADEAYQTNINTFTSTPPKPMQTALPDVSAVFQELDNLRAKVETQERKICDLQKEISEKDVRIQKLEVQLIRQLPRSDSLDDVMVIEDTRCQVSDSKALNNLRMLVQSYMHHLTPHYEAPTDPHALERDFANLINVKNDHL